jgi:transposase
MKDTALIVGMDVHKESISIAVLEGERGSGARPTVTVPNEPVKLRRFFGRLKKEGVVRACYEAGSCGYEVQRLLASIGISCDVVAPSLIPVRAGDRVKTDRRDAEKLARLFRAGELTSIRVPTEAEEALRDLVRCREDAREDALRERHRLLKFLLRHGHIFTESKHWTVAHSGCAGSASSNPSPKRSSSSTSRGWRAPSPASRRSTRSSRPRPSVSPTRKRSRICGACAESTR